MEEIVLDEVRRYIIERPKPTIDLEYLYSIRKQVQDFADQTNSQLKKNVYQNYSLFIESSREISTLKDEMRQLNVLLEEQQTSMGKLLDQLNKAPIIQQSVERPKNDPFRLELNEDTSELEAEMLPTWFTKSPEDFDVLIAQRNLREAVELAQRVKSHFEQYPKCCDSQADLRQKIETRIEELISSICSELQPNTSRSVQGGPRSSILSIRLLRELNLSSKAVKLYLDSRSLLLRFVLEQQKVEASMSPQASIKQTCSIFFQNAIETCNEFKIAFEVDKFVSKAVDEGAEKLGIEFPQSNHHQTSSERLLFDLVGPIYLSEHPPIEMVGSSATSILSNNHINYMSAAAAAASNSTNNNHNNHQHHHHHHHAENTLTNLEHSLMAAGMLNPQRSVFSNLSTYSSLTYWVVQELDNFIELFREHVFNNAQLTISMISESIHQLKSECSRLAPSCELDMTSFVDRAFKNETTKLIEESGRKLIQTIDDLNAAEQWQPQQFQNKSQLARFFEEMNEVELKTMPSYIFDHLKLKFTASKTSFARCFLLTVGDLAKLVSAKNKDHVDSVLAKAFQREMELVIEALKKTKQGSQVRFIMANSNFLLDKIILVADAQYTSITKGLKCQKLIDLRGKYQEKVKSVAKM